MEETWLREALLLEMYPNKGALLLNFVRERYWHCVRRIWITRVRRAFAGCLRLRFGQEPLWSVCTAVRVCPCFLMVVWAKVLHARLPWLQFGFMIEEATSTTLDTTSPNRCPSHCHLGNEPSLSTHEARVPQRILLSEPLARKCNILGCQTFWSAKTSCEDCTSFSRHARLNEWAWTTLRCHCYHTSSQTMPVFRNTI